jgi:hypothetical protein
MKFINLYSVILLTEIYLPLVSVLFSSGAQVPGRAEPEVETAARDRQALVFSIR